MKKIGVIDYGAGNLGSVMNALSHLGADACFTRGPEELKLAGGFEKIIFPGDGHFASAARSLGASGYGGAIRRWIEADKPFLGICIGLQLLFESSEEAPPSGGVEIKGLSVLPGAVKLFPGRKVPQIGWNKTFPKKSSKIFTGFEGGEFFYYINSYYAVPENPADISASAEYYVEFCSAVERGALCAMQFHPEKSGAAGLKLLENWLLA